ncbi:MAG: NADH-quinone oxidoreductase subunit L, partial [Planctomycetes bacterium]|nr:NADH-quinone oxidoreductase subunit L [Planctomycetota bacterium]
MDRETLSHLIWLIPLLPILGFAVNVFLGRGLPRFFVSVASCGVVLGSAILSWITFFAVRAGGPLVSSSLAWIDVPGTGPEAMLRVFLEHKLLADPLTCVMILVVTNVGFLIHLYSTAYMADDKRYARYFAFLNLFTGFMLILVMGSNLLLMFVGWEGVGLCSYLLIGFWFEKRENAAAGMKAFIVNRVGDFGFTVGLLLLFTYMGHAFGVWTLDFLELSSA